MTTFIDIHALQTIPPSNINRDDTGQARSLLSLVVFSVSAFPARLGSLLFAAILSRTSTVQSWVYVLA